MSVLQRAKTVVRRLQDTLDSTDAPGTSLRRLLADDFRWRGVHPFDAGDDVESALAFWQSLTSAFTARTRRETIFFAGYNEIDAGASTWVVSAGHMLALFDQPWLGIAATGKLIMLRYCTFYRVTEDSRIGEMVMHVDIPHLMQQAGQFPFAPETGAALVQPGPASNDGVLDSASDEDEGARTLALINSMIGHIGQWQSGLSLQAELALDWHPDMLWWGPAGIGSSYTIERYALQHAAPFRASFASRSSTGHLARLAEGHYGGFFGWPNFTALPSGGFMGLPGFSDAVEFRVVDLYRRRGEKLAENWVYIDLLHVLKQQGIDVLQRMASLRWP